VVGSNQRDLKEFSFVMYEKMEITSTCKHLRFKQTKTYMNHLCQRYKKMKLFLEIIIAMGLDMWLLSVSKIDSIRELNASREREIAYWRKFNALHDWFVINVQDDIDNCRPHIVTPDKLQELKQVLMRLTPENAPELFPTTPGFFFGSTEYGEQYWADVKATIDLLTSLEETDFTKTTIIYSSCW